MPQRAEDTIIAALMAGFWAGIMMEKLDAFAVRSNLTLLHVTVQWWPLLLIGAGLVLLLRHKQQQARVAVPARQVLVMPRPQAMAVESKEQVHAR